MSLYTRETTLSATPSFSGQVGLLAGGGRFPVLFAESARRQGIRVICGALRGHADRELADSVDHFEWVGIGKMAGMINVFRRQRVDCVVMAGKVRKVTMFAPWRLFTLLPDLRMIRAWLSRKRRDNADDSLLLTLIDEFRKDGIRFASALEICPELLVKAGVPTRRTPSAREQRDIAFGWRLAKEMGRLDVGQTVAVKESAVLAIEAIEGTDEAIKRAGLLCRQGGFTVVKVAKPNQDMRFDVPTVGEATIRTMHAAGARVLAIEADKTILLDSDPTVRLADQLGIAIVAMTVEEAAALPAVA